jgi:hypothetical protein
MKSPDEGVHPDQQADQSQDPEMIKVVDRKGNVKVIPRTQYETRKRSRKKHEQSKTLPVKEIISIIIIVAAILVASYFALTFVK